MKYVYLCLAIAMLSLTSCKNDKSDRDEAKIATEGKTVASVGVYICTGPNAERYHADRYCGGLSRCSMEIIQTTVADAEARGKTPCRLCTE